MLVAVAPDDTAERVFKARAQTVFRIEAGASTGSAVAITRPGKLLSGHPPMGAVWLVTNWHVIARAKHGQVKVLQGKTTDVVGMVIGADSEADLAIIEAVLPRAEVAPMREGVPSVGEAAFAIGAPLGLEGSLSGGLVSAIRGEMIQTSASLLAGSSGGGLFDAAGKLIGVTTLASKGQPLNFAVRTAAITLLLKDLRRASDPQKQVRLVRPTGSSGDSVVGEQAFTSFESVLVGGWRTPLEVGDAEFVSVMCLPSKDGRLDCVGETYQHWRALGPTQFPSFNRTEIAWVGAVQTGAERVLTHKRNDTCALTMRINLEELSAWLEGDGEDACAMLPVLDFWRRGARYRLLSDFEYQRRIFRIQDSAHAP